MLKRRIRKCCVLIISRPKSIEFKVSRVILVDQQTYQQQYFTLLHISINLYILRPKYETMNDKQMVVNS